jgi:hypothetical protein
MKYPLLLILTLASIVSFAQSDLRRVSVSDLPEDIRNIENISVAVRWTDSLGDNVLVTTSRTIKTKIDEGIHDNDGSAPYNELKRIQRMDRINRGTANVTGENLPTYTYHFLIARDTAVLTWKSMSITKICDREDGSSSKQWFAITDLDHDSKAEVWLIYKAVCMDDENSAVMKIVMIENEVRYTVSDAIQGQSVNTNYFNQNFGKYSEQYKNYAVQLWNKFVDK